MKTLAIIPLLLSITFAACSKQPRQTVKNAEQSVRSAARRVEDKAALALHSTTKEKSAMAEAKPSAAMVAKSHRRRR